MVGYAAAVDMGEVAVGRRAGTRFDRVEAFICLMLPELLDPGLRFDSGSSVSPTPRWKQCTCKQDCGFDGPLFRVRVMS